MVLGVPPKCKKKRLDRVKPFRPKVRFMATYQKAGASCHVNTAASAGVRERSGMAG
jgi:hypothetical protein